MLIVQGVLPLGGVKQWWDGGKQAILQLNMSISQTVGDTSKVTIYD